MDPAQITNLRRRLALSQPQFALLLGVHAITVSKWERSVPGAVPTPYQNALMAEFEKAAASREAEQIRNSLGTLLVGAGIAAALLMLLKAADR